MGVRSFIHTSDITATNIYNYKNHAISYNNVFKFLVSWLTSGYYLLSLSQ